MKLIFGEGGGECKCRQRVKAFMTMLRVGEATLNDIGYETIVGFTYFKDYGKDFSDHPNILGAKNSKAAGAYQITMLNWNDYNFKKWRTDNKVTDFTPVSQDKYAVYLIRDKKKGLDLIKKGHISEAVHKMGAEWSSLPGADPDQRSEKMEDVINNFIKYYNLELSGETMLHINDEELDKMIGKCNCKKGDFYDNTGDGKIIDLREKVTYFDQGLNNANCNLTSRAILKQIGLDPENPSEYSDKQPQLAKASYFQLAEEDNTTRELEFYNDDFVNGVKYLDEALEKGEPVMVGTDHTYMYVPKSVGTRINEYTTDHYVLIIGRNYKDGKVVYPYLDVGTQFGGKGDYYFTLESDRLISNSRKNKNYTVTQIRRNGKLKK